MKKACLVAHQGEDFLSYRQKFLSYLQNIDYECFAFVPEDNFTNDVRNSGTKVYFYKYQRNWKFVFYIPQFLYKLYKVLSREKPDIIFTYKFMPNLIAIPLARLIGINKIAGTLAGIGFMSKKDESVLVSILFKIYCSALNKAHFVIFQNNEDLELFRESLPKPKLVLSDGSGVDLDRFSQQPDNLLFLNQNKLSSTKKYLLFSTRIVRDKGIFELIEAYKKACKAGQIKYDLLIAGWFDEVGLQKKVMPLIDNTKGIIWVGYQRDMSALLSISSCMILPSYYPEGIPRSITEAMAMKKPIITTDYKGCKETCINNQNGFLVKPKSSDSLSKALVKFDQLSEPKIREMGEMSYSRFLEKFEQKVVFKSISNSLSIN